MEIICSVPECISLNDTPIWSLVHYCMHVDNSYTVCDDDGNHEPCDHSDIPSGLEENEMWQDYYQYVAKTGTDPIHDFVIPKIKTHWQAKFRSAKGKLVVDHVRQVGQDWINPDKATQGVRDYLLIQKKGHFWICEEFDSLENLLENVPESSQLHDDDVIVNFELEEDMDDEQAKEWLKQAATNSM